MAGNQLANNLVNIVGHVVADLEYSHELFGESFYQTRIEVPRLSQFKDILPVTISERLIEGMDIKIGSRLYIEGQLRSYNRIAEDGLSHLMLTIFARDLRIVDEEEVFSNPNEILLDGFICKKPVYRTTPFGREITDLLLAVNRPYNKSDYIPIIAWGRNARFCEKLNVGEHIKIWGRVQSRSYQKKISEEEVISRTAYEISISKMEIEEAGKDESEDKSKDDSEDISENKEE